MTHYFKTVLKKLLENPENTQDTAKKANMMDIILCMAQGIEADSAALLFKVVLPQMEVHGSTG